MAASLRGPHQRRIRLTRPAPIHFVLPLFFYLPIRIRTCPLEEETRNQIHAPAPEFRAPPFESGAPGRSPGANARSVVRLLVSHYSLDSLLPVNIAHQQASN